MTTWDAEQYQRFSDERSRPFFDLVNRIRADQPETVVDLGCGPGNLTATLATRWPSAHIVGLDNDDNMLATAQAHSNRQVTFAKEDVSNWKPTEPVDVIISNATLQWLPAHLRLLKGYVDALNPSGWLAFQVPGNFDDPHHQAIREVMAQPRWLENFRQVPERQASSYPATTYLSMLSDLGCSVDAWETSYVHVLNGNDPVLEWVKGTALRPFLAMLTPEQQPGFLSDLATLLRRAYGTAAWGTMLPFRRVFVVAQRTP
jgi:trans-aconitate 2-methyltransferase